MLLVAVLVFVYYTTWTFLMPFVDSTHALQLFFPPREWAIRLPVIILVLGLTVIGSFVGSVMVKAAEKEKAKKLKESTKKAQ
ncbi:hypothetical protein NADFUDRAFT_83993 [Nadsonia fulvescens var. elongata DSM 6958]|uniref:Dolichol phosphate-mannose biosynthesis regulatory protein n=1 Tax=Nadsonia fulvescens var. elongata DSM 6958 TaxID=857566 RepID=A0A1E3PG63_9ASCO|nr:hypothetical protein NADFUDRAFT_83993 [Nadsonia fulvescens var. elongata DSM 6958]